MFKFSTFKKKDIGLYRKWVDYYGTHALGEFASLVDYSTMLYRQTMEEAPDDLEGATLEDYLLSELEDQLESDKRNKYVENGYNLR